MQQVNLLRKTPEDTPLQVLVRSSPHCYLTLTNTHISILGGIKVARFGQQLYVLQRNQYNTPLQVLLTFTGHMTSINTHISISGRAMGSSLKDVRTNLGISGIPPPSVQACPHLVDHPPPAPHPSPCLRGHETGII